MEPIIQTLTLATILLIIGLICMVLGIFGLAWRIGHDKRRIEKTGNVAMLSENTDSLPRQQPNSSQEQSLTP